MSFFFLINIMISLNVWAASPVFFESTDASAQAGSYVFDFKALSVQTKEIIGQARFTITLNDGGGAIPVSGSDGRASARLDSGSTYLIDVRADKYEPAQFMFDAGQSLRDKRQSVDLFLVPLALSKEAGLSLGSAQDKSPAIEAGEFGELKKGSAVTLQHIFFDQSSPVLRPESGTELDKLTEMLRMNPDMHIEIRGYTDNTGNFEANVKLSEQRCDAVITYLTEKGISAKRLRAVGRGPRNPVAPNTSEDNKKKNRRVEFVIL